MSYALGQAKWIPGQIHFQTTRTGRLPSLQPLIERGLPIAPYIEHGSYATGQPAIMRYGRDPYRGLAADPFSAASQRAEDVVAETIRATLSPAIMITTGAVVGAAAGLAGGFIKKPIWSALLGAVGGGALGFVGWKNFMAPAAQMGAGTEAAATSGLGGILAVL